MKDLRIIADQTVALPGRAYQARHFINGAAQDSADGRRSDRISPSHGVVVSQAALGSEIEAEAAIKAARAAFDDGRWSRLTGKARAAVLTRAADLIEANVERLALIETLESGKPISQARGECGGAADLWRYAAALARSAHGDSHNTLGKDILGVVLKEPIGVVSIITPWNFPFWILSQKLPFALAAGCTCVVKPSEMTPSTTAMLAGLLSEAGLPAGVCNIVLGYGDPVGALLCSHADVDMVTFTGSTAVGKLITKAAGDTVKKVALELGGKNPQVIFPDADLESAADAVTFGIYFNVGQCCNSSSRLLLHEDIADAFIDRVITLSRQVTFGNPLHPDTQVGAIVTAEHQAKIDRYVQDAVRAGAWVCMGGAALDVPGLGRQFYQPTVIRDVTPDMAIAREEVFGPVLTVLTFRTLDQAIALTNDSTYGLSAGLWSENVHTCLEFARRAQAGTIWTKTWMDRWLARARTPWDAYPDTVGGKMDAETCGLKAALASPNVTLRTGAQVTRLLAGAGGRIEAVTLASGQTMRAPLIVLAAGAVQTAALLLASADTNHPRGLANRSDQVGRNFMNHNSSAGLALHPWRRNASVYQKTLMVNDFYLTGGPAGEPLGNIQLLGKISGPILAAQSALPGLLANWIAARSVDLYAMSEDLPHPESRVTLHRGQIRLDWRRSNWQAHLMLVARLKALLRRAGFPVVLSRAFDRRTPSHQCGTARMGRDPEKSVVDSYGRCHDHPNLFIADAAVLPTSAAVNPALTIAALALRSADHIARTELAA